MYNSKSALDFKYSAFSALTLDSRFFIGLMARREYGDESPSYDIEAQVIKPCIKTGDKVIRLEALPTEPTAIKPRI